MFNHVSERVSYSALFVVHYPSASDIVISLHIGIVICLFIVHCPSASSVVL